MTFHLDRGRILNHNPYLNIHSSANHCYILAVIGFAVAVFSGCSKHDPPPPPPSVPANVLATIGDESITSEQFEAELASRRTANDPKTRNALLDDLIRVRVLAQEARRRGYDRDPQVIAAYDSLLAGRVSAEVHAQAKPSAQEIEAYYQAHPAEFNSPAAVRAAVIFVAAAPQLSAEIRGQRRAAIDSARQKALALPPSVFGFGALSAQYSEDQETKPRGGDMGYLVEGTVASRWEKPVIEAAFALSSEGALSEVVTTNRGYYLLRLIARRTAAVRPLEVARAQIERNLADEKEQHLTAELMREASAKEQIKVYEDRLIAVPVPKPLATTPR